MMSVTEAETARGGTVAHNTLEELSDTDLVDRAREGDDAFAEIVRRHDQQLRGLVHRLMADDGSADDVMQEAYLRAFRGLPRFRREASLATWLYRITYNVCMDHLRRRPSHERPRSDEVPEPVWPGRDPGDVATVRRTVSQALAELHPDQRVVAQLVDGNGLDYAEAAMVLRLPPGTVASRLSRARAALRRSLEAA